MWFHLHTFWTNLFLCVCGLSLVTFTANDNKLKRKDTLTFLSISGYYSELGVVTYGSIYMCILSTKVFMHPCCSAGYSLKNGSLYTIPTPCLRRFITLHHDPLAQQTSCLKCLLGLASQVCIPWSDGYIICLQEIHGLLFFIISTFNSANLPEVVCLIAWMYLLQISQLTTEKTLRLQ